MWMRKEQRHGAGKRVEGCAEAEVGCWDVVWVYSIAPPGLDSPARSPASSEFQPPPPQ